MPFNLSVPPFPGGVPQSNIGPQLPPEFMEEEGFPMNGAGGPDLSGFESLIGTLTQQMNEVGQMQGVPQAPVPQPANALASMGAVFAASLSDSLTGRRTATLAVQRTLGQHQQKIDEVERENRSTDAVNILTKQKHHLAYLGQIAQVEQAQAEAIGDWALARKAAEDQLKYLKEEDKINKLEDENDHRQAMELVGERERVKSKGKPDPQADVQKFTDQVESELARKDIYERAGGVGFGGWQVLKRVPRQKLQTRFYSTAISADSPELREVALEYYFDTLLDNNGQIRDNEWRNPEVQRFMRLLVKWYPDGGDEWLTRHGIIAPETQSISAPSLAAPDTTNVPQQ